MPNNPTGKVGFRNLTKPMKALVLAPTVVLTIWMIALQNAVNSAFDDVNKAFNDTDSVNALRDFIIKKFSGDKETGPLKNAGTRDIEVDLGFSFDVSLMDILKGFWHLFITLAPAIVILALVILAIRKFRSRRRPTPGAPSGH